MVHSPLPLVFEPQLSRSFNSTMRTASHRNPLAPHEMRGRRRATSWLWLMAILTGCICPIAHAEEPYLEFIRGLREHRHYDFALTYLDELDASTDLPAEIRAVIPYERGMTFLEQARQTFDLDRQRDYLDRAAASLEQFVASAGEHPLAGQANTDRAIILLERAKLEIWKSDEPANEGNEDGFRQAARDLITQAREVFQAALVQHQVAFEEFPIYIPEEEIELRAQRDQAEARVLQGEMYLAQCTYWQAHTYAKAAPEYRDTLTLASVEFEEIHKAHRSQIVGLYARLWQGKCFEEQDELGAAIGIYDQFIDYPGISPIVVQLRSTAVQFKLICLNHELRKDYQVAADMAGEWLRADETRLLRRTEIGFGITYERARALEGLATTLEETDPKRSDALNQALGLARSINIFPGQYKIASTRMIQQLMLALNRDPRDPRDFESANGIGIQFLDDVTALVAEIQRIEDSGDLTQLPEKLESVRAAAVEMTRMFDLAIRLAKSNTDPRQLQLAHMRLAYGYLSQQKYYEAAAIAEYLMQKRAEDFPDLAIECGFIGVMAYDNAYAQAPAEDRKFEEERLVELATMFETLFPDSDRANYARMTVAKVFFNQGDHIVAADWFNKVPDTADDYGQAQLQAGQSFWRAYNDSLALEGAERPMEADTWLDLAQTHLTTGVTARQARLTPEVTTPDDLARGKVSLAALLVQKGIYSTQGDVPGAIEVLATEPHSVVSAIRVPPDTARPKDNSIRSTQLASYSLQQLLRAQIGAASQSEGEARQKFMEDSANTRVLLEELAAEGGDQGALTQIYVQFGEELQKELERLQESGEVDRLRAVRVSFESFLNELADRQEGQTRSSLLWIAETFAALGENATDDPAKAEAYFSRAAGTFENMLNRALNETGFVQNPDQIVLIRLSLARTHRRAGDFPEAETALNEVLTAYANAVDVQEEAALLYELWGDSGVPEKYTLAIRGRTTAPEIWGWNKLCLRLQSAMQQAQADPAAAGKFLNAKVHQVNCLLGFASTGSSDVHTASLDLAKFTLESLALTYNESLLAPRMSDFNRQYAEVLAALDQPVVPLAQVSAANASAQPAVDEDPTENESAETETTTTDSEAETESEGETNWGLIVGLLVVGAGSVAGLCYLSIQQNQKRRQARMAKVAAMSDRSRGPTQVR